MAPRNLWTLYLTSGGRGLKMASTAPDHGCNRKLKTSSLLLSRPGILCHGYIEKQEIHHRLARLASRAIAELHFSPKHTRTWACMVGSSACIFDLEDDFDFLDAPVPTNCFLHLLLSSLACQDWLCKTGLFASWQHR